MRLTAIDRDAREAVALSCTGGAQGCWLTYDEPSRSQAICRDQLLRADASDLFVRGQYDAQTIDPLGTLNSAAARRHAQKSLHVAGAATVKRLFLSAGCSACSQSFA